METYGVSFEGFEPSYGRQFYDYIKDEFLPKLRARAECWRKLYDTSVDKCSALKQFNVDLETMAKCSEGMMAKLRTKFSEGRDMAETQTMDEIMLMGVQEAEQDGEKVETKHSWTELSAWLKEADSFFKEMAVYNEYALKRANCSLGEFHNCVESTEADIHFWEQTLELQRAFWVFEKAELKYKTKICRGIVKMLNDYIGNCSEQLGRFCEEVKSECGLYKDIKWLFDEAQKDLAYYRQIKADIAATGVEEAIRLSSRKVTQPIDNYIEIIPSAASDYVVPMTDIGGSEITAEEKGWDAL